MDFSLFQRLRYVILCMQRAYPSFGRGCVCPTLLPRAVGRAGGMGGPERAHANKDLSEWLVT